jgi:hypothetical protein
LGLFSESRGFRLQLGRFDGHGHLTL